MATKNQTCLSCRSEITKFPKWYCYICEAYLCNKCYTQNKATQSNHFFLLDQDPIIPDPLLICIECKCCIPTKSTKFFCYECLEYICKGCNDKYPNCNNCNIIQLFQKWLFSHFRYWIHWFSINQNSKL